MKGINMTKEEVKRHTGALELDKVLRLLAEHASCEDSRKLIYDLEFSTDLETVKAALLQTSDAHMVIARYGSPSVYGLKNIDNPLTRARAGGVLSMGELLHVGEALRTVRGFQSFYQKWGALETSLDMLFEGLRPDRDLEDQIFGSIRSDEEMDDHASSALADIRRKIRQMEGKVRDMLDSMTRSSHYQKYLQDALVTMRDGRYVIPVKAEHRSEVKGLVHDTSSSGATLFIEPMGVVEANNDIRVQKSKEQDEIQRILSALSAQVGDVAEMLAYNYDAIISIDACFAKARFAYEINAALPQVNGEGIVDLSKARHPLIGKDSVVPIDIRLGDGFDTLMITGPNTGGKTVALKTLGLLTLMTMCGMMIPAAEGSKVAVFENILADIGDEQSIEQSLSTFSAHMTHIISILELAGDNSLVLLDELGAGTDPVEGAALARAILENLRSCGAKIAATTHYAELKVFALETPGVENASCEFDIASLRPTYKLLIGVPGRSNAFAISERLGIKKEIVDGARALVSSEKSRFEDVVSALEEQRLKLEDEREQARVARVQAQHYRDSVKKSYDVQEQQREKEMERARNEARAIVERVQADANRLMDELSKIRKQKDSEEFRNLAGQAKSMVDSRLNELSNSAKLAAENKNEGYKLPRPIRAGDTVLMVDIGKRGTVISEPDNSGTVMVQAGIMKTKVKVSSLRLEEGEKVTAQFNRPATRTVRSKAAGAATREVDLRGMNVEEALVETDKALDESVFSNVSMLTLIHGKGTGTLRKAIHTHLKGHPNVRFYRLGVFGEGESGVTVVEVK